MLAVKSNAATIKKSTINVEKKRTTGINTKYGIKVNNVYYVGGGGGVGDVVNNNTTNEQQQQQLQRSTTAPTINTYNNYRISNNNHNDDAPLGGGVAGIGRMMGLNINHYNFRFLNEPQQQFFRLPAPQFANANHRHHQPLHHLNREHDNNPLLQQHPFYIEQQQQQLQYFDAYDNRQQAPIIIDAADDNNDPQPEYPQHPLQQEQLQQQQQYANHRYGLPLSIGFNIGSWCTRSWG